MALFDDPVAAMVGDTPVLWLGTDADVEGIMAIVVGVDGHVSVIDIKTLRAAFRYIDGEWVDLPAATSTETETSTGVTPVPQPGVIFDSFGNKYDEDGDPL